MAARKTWLRSLRLASALMALTYGGFALAESARLTQASVKKFIASYPEIRTIAVTEGKTKSKKIGAADNQLMAVVEAASDDAIKGKIDVTAQRHGFRDSDEWFGVARSVGMAYAHVKAGTGGGDAKVQKKVEKALAKIDDMDFLSDKQKKKLKDAAQKGAAVALEPQLPENVAVVKSMAPDIEAVVK